MTNKRQQTSAADGEMAVFGRSTRPPFKSIARQRREELQSIQLQVSESGDPRMAIAPDPQRHPARPHAAGDRLDSWKEIAAHLRRGERTVRRWEQTEGLPVYRHGHLRRASVYAFRSELDSWWQSRGVRLEEPEVAPADISGDPINWRRRLIVAALLAAFAVSGAIVWRFAEIDTAPQAPMKMVPLTSLPGSERYPSFSRDGNQVAFCWRGEKEDNFDIYVQQVGAGPPLRLTSHPDHDWSPAWSPDGRSIAFLRWSSGAMAAVFLIPSLPGPERKLADTLLSIGRGPFYGSYLAWSPDSKWVVTLDRASREQPIGLFLVSLATGEKRRLTSPPPNTQDMAPAFAPDGRTLAFIRVFSFAVSELLFIPLTADFQPAGEPRQLTFERRFTTSPAWTADGSEIIFSSGQLWSARALWKIAPFGFAGRPGKPQRLPVNVEDGSVFAISRKGPAGPSRLAYAREFFDPNIWRVELPGANAQPGAARNFIFSTRTDFNPQFSPKGDKIAFESTRSGSHELWVCSGDGSNSLQLTSFDGPVTGTPRWSPDGQHIVFNSHIEAQADIYFVSSNGGPSQRLTHEPSNELFPSWSRDGRWIYFCSNRSGVAQVWKIPAPSVSAESRQATQVTREGGLAAFESIDGRFVYYSKGVHSGISLWRVPAEGGEERQVLESLRDWSTFAVTDRGIYFAPKANPAAGGSIQFLSFASGKIKKVVDIEKPVFVGLSVSPDGRSILYTQVDREDSDLMLVENFR